MNTFVNHKLTVFLRSLLFIIPLKIHCFFSCPHDDFLNIMTGTEPVEEMWAEIVKGYEANGLEDMIQQVNDALAAEQ